MKRSITEKDIEELKMLIDSFNYTVRDFDNSYKTLKENANHGHSAQWKKAVDDFKNELFMIKTIGETVISSANNLEKMAVTSKPFMGVGG